LDVVLSGVEGLIIYKHLIGVTPCPTLARLCGDYCRMLRFMIMFCSVLIWGVITAMCYAACLACAKMYPAITGFNALFAYIIFSLFYAL
jgi:hypothetical protein